MTRPFWLVPFAVVLLFPVSLSRGQDLALSKETLRAHGVGLSSPALVDFLERGWQAARRSAPSPQVPRRKSSLLVDAWQLLALRYPEIRSQPILRFRVGNLACRYAFGDFPKPILEMIEEDGVREAPESGAMERMSQTELLRYNGMIAMGIFAAPTAELLRDARKVFDSEDRPIVRVAYGATLAMLGDRDALGYLVAEAAKANDSSSVAAARFLEILLGKAIGITPVTAAEPRREAARNFERWWKHNGENVRVDRERAIARQLAHRTPAPYPLKSLEDLLRASADAGDVTDRLGSRTAWNRLHDMAQADREGFVEQILPIVKDRRRDLDIRDQAIRWYVRLKGQKAKRLLARLRKDPNPPVAALARQFLESLAKQAKDR